MCWCKRLTLGESQMVSCSSCLGWEAAGVHREGRGRPYIKVGWWTLRVLEQPGRTRGPVGTSGPSSHVHAHAHVHVHARGPSCSALAWRAQHCRFCSCRPATNALVQPLPKTMRGVGHQGTPFWGSRGTLALVAAATSVWWAEAGQGGTVGET